MFKTLCLRLHYVKNLIDQMLKFCTDIFGTYRNFSRVCQHISEGFGVEKNDAVVRSIYHRSKLRKNVPS